MTAIDEFGDIDVDCDAETLGMCDADPDQFTRYIHDCHHPDGHDSQHQCACGRTWTDTDDG